MSYYILRIFIFRLPTSDLNDILYTLTAMRHTLYEIQDTNDQRRIIATEHTEK